MKSVLAPPLLTIAQVAKRLSLSESATANLIHRGELRSVKLGDGLRAPVRVDEDDLETYIQLRKKGGQAPAPLVGRKRGPGSSSERASQMRAHLAECASFGVKPEFVN